MSISYPRLCFCVSLSVRPDKPSSEIKLLKMWWLSIVDLYMLNIDLKTLQVRYLYWWIYLAIPAMLQSSMIWLKYNLYNSLVNDTLSSFKNGILPSLLHCKRCKSYLMCLECEGNKRYSNNLNQSNIRHRLATNKYSRSTVYKSFYSIIHVRGICDCEKIGIVA